MNVKVLDGRKIQQQILEKLRKDMETRKCPLPRLDVFRVGNDKASEIYVKCKKEAADKVGILLWEHHLSSNISQEELLDRLKPYNENEVVHGIIVQVPLPSHIDTDTVVNHINPQKDVDGFSLANRDAFKNGTEYFYPVFPKAIMTLINDSNIELSGKKAVVLGKSDLFDSVMTYALERAGLITNFITMLPDLIPAGHDYDMIRSADVVVTALGRPDFLRGEHFKDGAVVIDGGIAKKNGKTVGDVHFDSCRDRNIVLSPVPGGVGPVTVACLLENTFIASGGSF